MSAKTQRKRATREEVEAQEEPVALHAFNLCTAPVVFTARHLEPQLLGVSVLRGDFVTDTEISEASLVPEVAAPSFRPSSY